MKKTLLLFCLSLTISSCALMEPQVAESPAEKPLETPEPQISDTAETAVNPAETVAAQQSSEASANQTEEKEYKLLGPTVDLWSRIRSRFSLAEQSHPRIEKQLAWYSRHQGYMDRVAERAKPYLYFIVKTLEEEDVPSELALLPIVESAFQPFAYSHGRAAGIWQFIPSTGRRYGLKQNWWYDGRRDVYASTHAAIRLLKALANEFDGDWLLALAAYNSGSGTVHRAIRHNKRRGRPTDFFSLDLPRETRAYVPKLLAIKTIVADPQAHGMTLTSIPNEPYFKQVSVDSQIDLSLAAELADIPINDLYSLNPGHNRWATPPNGPHYLLLPKDKAEGFEQRLAEIPDRQLIKWTRHRIRSGETLSTIAEKYHTSIRVIKRVNRIHGKTIRAGRSLTIPVARKSLRSYKLSASQRRSTKQNIPRQGIKVTHIVRSGDTFWDLAQLHKVGVRQLAKWNNMAPRDPLRPGTKLVIWSRTGKQVSHNDPGNINIPLHRQIMKRIGYRVRHGDSLARISQKFKVSINQLLRWNKLRRDKILRPGQFLTLFVDVTRQSGS
jgi:membrane-bound lytic murein transglycosylase D